MDVNDNAGHLIPRGAWTTIASKLAPTRAVFQPPIISLTMRSWSINSF